jgi:transposase-like protein
MVGTDAARVEQDLQAGRLSCPECEAELRPWGFARPRTLRARGTRAPPFRPRRSRCRGCLRTHVLLTILALVRRVDLAEVIGEALVRAAAGAGHRTIAGVLCLPPTTVREWLRRFTAHAERIRAHFTRLAVWLDPSLAPATPRSTPVADAVEAIGLAAQAAGRRLGNQPVWPFVSGATAGRLLANASSPLAASWERTRLPG